MARVLVTGANGFVGRQLCADLVRHGHHVRAAVRRASSVVEVAHECIEVGDIGARTDWSLALRGIDVVVHAAARVHVLHDSAANEALYIETNAQGTKRLAAAAADSGARRLVVVSSIKVNGEGDEGRVYRATDVPGPRDAYGRSKHAAETLAFGVGRERGIEVTVVRPPLVYGPGVRANFLRLMRAVAHRRPLPLGALQNRRSLVGVWNLTDLLRVLVDAPGASGKVWLVADAESVSTPELIRRMASALDVQPRLIPVPAGLLRLAGKLLGKGDEMRRLCGALEVDSQPTRQELSWTPPVSLDEGLVRTAAWLRSSGGV